MKSISAAKVEYVEVVDSHTLLPVTTAQDGTTICVAVWFDDVRLIDNISI
jgi:pantothenate synthetase